MKAKWEKMVDGKALVDSCRDFAATQNWLRLKGVTYKDDGKVLLSVNVAEWVLQYDELHRNVGPSSCLM